MLHLIIIKAAFVVSPHACNDENKLTLFFSMWSADDRLQHLSKHHFWKSKYQQEVLSFDWFLSKENLSQFVKHVLQQYQDKIISAQHSVKAVENTLNLLGQFHILDLGCGSSALPECFYQWEHYPVSVQCLDYIYEAVQYQMHSMKLIRPGNKNSQVHGVCANACCLPYRSDIFHLITEKGTMDSLLKDTRTGQEKARQMFQEVYRVLQNGGVFMQISDEDPDSRLFFLEDLSGFPCRWTVLDLAVDYEMNNNCFVYSFQKWLKT